MSDREPSREVSRWLRYAREDLDIAVSIVQNGQAMRASCFHAQQCAEKAIKAAFIFLQMDFRKTHDLELLFNELPEGWDLAGNPEHLSWLTVWAVEPRYPGDLPEATEADAATAVRQAREVYEKTISELGSRGFEVEGM